MKLRLFTTFHLNLAYSSIEESQRLDVIRRCYWPLLRLAQDLDLPLGIEAPAFTLETAGQLDPAWLEELKRLVVDGPCEFVGSGYSQLIGPLVPADVNRANLRIGNEAYERLLGFRPQTALINEQAYSCGLVRHYLEAGCRAVVMEWDNPAHNHPEWPAEWRYLPQVACGQRGEEIPVIWNKSVAFQKFQRLAQGELEMDEYMEYLGRHVAATPRAFPLYGNDAEIFDFRPGRYQTEAAVSGEEWGRIRRLMDLLKTDSRFAFVRPLEVVDLMKEPGAGNRLHLESAEVPVPVKKQEKYNLTRWSVTGRDDLSVNTACWQIHESLKAGGKATEDDWRELCFLWSSDFRTHITEKRWATYRERLAKMQKRFVPAARAGGTNAVRKALPPEVRITRASRFLTIETDRVALKLNCRRGMAIDSLVFKDVSETSLCGTLAHGYYDDISMAADYYTGHVVFEAPGQPKITDLASVEPELSFDDVAPRWCAAACLQTSLGVLKKQIRGSLDSSDIELIYELDAARLPSGSLRLGAVTLNPEAFDARTLFYRTHNGGADAEAFALAGRHVRHGEPTSLLVSAQHGLGVTEGTVELGDARHSLAVSVDKTESALIAFVIHRRVGSSYFCRLIFSAREVDETSLLKNSVAAGAAEPLRARIALSARRISS